MKSIIPMISGGAAAVLKGMPMRVTAPLLLGVGLLGGAELVIEGNHALNSGAIFGGQGQAALSDARTKTAEADAATKTPRELRALDERGEASSAEALRRMELDLKERDIAVREREIDVREAEAREKKAIADAANESEEQLVAKLRHGVKLTSTENIRLQELRKARALATVEEANAYAADSQAVLNKQAAEWGSRVIQGMTGNGNGKGSGVDMRRLQNNIWNGRF
jgi:hypothetical protein